MATLLPSLDPTREPDSLVRMYVAMAIGRIGGKSALEALLPLLDSARESDRDVRQHVAYSLGRAGGECALETLISRLDPVREADSDVREIVAVKIELRIQTHRALARDGVGDPPAVL